VGDSIPRDGYRPHEEMTEGGRDEMHPGGDPSSGRDSAGASSSGPSSGEPSSGGGSLGGASLGETFSDRGSNGESHRESSGGTTSRGGSAESRGSQVGARGDGTGDAEGGVGDGGVAGRAANDEIRTRLQLLREIHEQNEASRFRSSIGRVTGLAVTVVGVAILLGVLPRMEEATPEMVILIALPGISCVAYGFQTVVASIESGRDRRRDMDREVVRGYYALMDEIEGLEEDLETHGDGVNAFNRVEKNRIARIYEKSLGARMEEVEAEGKSSWWDFLTRFYYRRFFD